MVTEGIVLFLLFLASAFVGCAIYGIVYLYCEKHYDDPDLAKKSIGKTMEISGLFLLLFTFFWFFSDYGWVGIVLFVLGPAVSFSGVVLNTKGSKKDIDRRKEYFHLEGSDRHNEKLVVFKTGPFVGEVLDYTEIHEWYLRQDPLKVHVGGAMAGDVFSGGVYTTGGKTRIEIGSGTGVYSIFYYDNNVKTPAQERHHSINRIELKGDAATAAKKSAAISKVLKGTDVLYLETKGSKEYCRMVKNWLSQGSGPLNQPKRKPYQPEPNKELENKYIEMYKNMSPEELNKRLEELTKRLENYK